TTNSHFNLWHTNIGQCGYAARAIHEGILGILRRNPTLYLYCARCAFATESNENSKVVCRVLGHSNGWNAAGDCVPSWDCRKALYPSERSSSVHDVCSRDGYCACRKAAH